MTAVEERLLLWMGAADMTDAPAGSRATNGFAFGGG
jgi:hypothetical protein